MIRLLDFVRRVPDAEVLVVTNMWPEKGRWVYGIHVKRQVDSLVALGVRCDVLYIRGYVSQLAYPLAAAFFAWTSIAWRGRYRLFHVHAAETALAARFHVGTPMIATYLGDDILGDRRPDGTQSRRAALRARLLRAHAALFPATVVVARLMAETLPRRARARAVIAPQGVDAHAFRPMVRAEARARLGWDAAERVTLFAATKPNSPAKRLWLAREACTLVAARGVPVRLHVASGVAPDELPLLMNASDCLLVTSAVEGSPNVVKEALMCSLPVVATPAGDIEELLRGVEPSWVCSPDADELAAALAECLAERPRSNGRERAGHLRAEVIAARILDVYRSLAGSDIGQTTASAAPNACARTTMQERV